MMSSTSRKRTGAKKKEDAKQLAALYFPPHARAFQWCSPKTPIVFKVSAVHSFANPIASFLFGQRQQIAHSIHVSRNESLISKKVNFKFILKKQDFFIKPPMKFTLWHHQFESERSYHLWSRSRLEFSALNPIRPSQTPYIRLFAFNVRLQLASQCAVSQLSAADIIISAHRKKLRG